MVQVIQRQHPRQQSTAESFAQALGVIGKGAVEGMQSRKQSQQIGQKLKQITGEELSGLPPEMQKALAVELTKGMEKQKKLTREQEFFTNLSNKRGQGNKFSEQPLMEDLSQENKPMIQPKEIKQKPWEEEDILAASMTNPSMAKVMTEDNKAFAKDKTEKERKIEDKAKQERNAFEADRTFHSKTSDPILQKARETIASAPSRKGLLNQQRRDIASGETSGFLPFMADK